MAVSLDDVAARAGVSTATVSRALRGLPRVSAATRTRVEAAARDLGYVASPAAAWLATGRTRNIGVVVPHVDRWFYGQVIAGAEGVLRQAGLDLLLYNLGGPDGRDRFFAEMPLRRRVDAVLLLAVPMSAGERETLERLDVPIAAVGMEQPGMRGVGIDDTAAAETAMRHLALLGHRDIAFIGAGSGTPLGFRVPMLRRAAYLRVRASLGRSENPDFDLDGDFTVAGGQAAMSRLLAGEQRPTAVFAASDEMAFGAMRALRKSGLRVPEDVSLIGFDDHEMADLLDLTTIAQPVFAQGERAARMLIAQLAGETVPQEPVVLPTELLIRGSTAALRPA
ncbi:MAG TPA: LacI family DNA-binding transcriptional regulator [Streptomyces sp.]|jgi:DNA-binding LacI/PurR family transcriptional regulator|nr:LacI family DNA-binding transcriptional regulator [Streptomyces sp.]